MKRAAPGRAPAHVRSVLALLVAVVGLLCVFAHAESGARGTPAPTAERVHTAAAAPAAARRRVRRRPRSALTDPPLRSADVDRPVRPCPRIL